MKDDAQMFLLGAVLLSVVFFATAALQSSTPYVVQAGTQNFENVNEVVTTFNEIEASASDECSGVLVSRAVKAACVESIVQYWGALSGEELGVSWVCNPIFDNLEFELSLSTGHALAKYEFEMEVPTCL